MRQRLPGTPSTYRNWLRILIWFLVFCLVIATAVLMLLLNTKTVVISNIPTQSHKTASELPPLPLGVDPIAKVIEENPAVDEYMADFVASNHTKPNMSDSWFDRALARLTELDWYQNLATPATRILIIQSGERYEEVARNFSRILRWSNDDTELFISRLMDEVPKQADGKLYPGRYIVTNDATPEAVAIEVAERFNAEVRTRYTDDIESKIPLGDALIVASLIEREAYDFTDMRYISGVIWNRLFIDMKLQIDATLQYARGVDSAAAGGRFWPVPHPQDKFIKSPYNTYKHAGLPPTPIANPSIDAIIAALNPKETDCLFYYHTDDGTFYCNATYEAHVAGIKEHLK
jgi:cell division protein YceG involved in septum cleavage